MELKNGKKINAGDCLAYKIKKDKEFKGRYLILIATELNNDDCPSYNGFFRCKITENDILVTTKEEIEKLEYILISIMPMEMRFSSLDGIRANDEEVIKEKNTVKVYPDDNGYLYEYTFGMTKEEENSMPDFIYLGNFDISKPKEDFIPYNIVNMPGRNIAYFEQYVLKRYRLNNLKQSEIWTDVAGVHKRCFNLLNSISETNKLLDFIHEQDKQNYNFTIKKDVN